jgi:hypothetical protein
LFRPKMQGTPLYYPANDYLVKFHQIPSYITKICLWHCIKYKASNSGTIKVNIIKNERDPSLFMSKLLLKFQNILRYTTQVIILPTSVPSKVSTDSIMHQVILWQILTRYLEYSYYMQFLIKIIKCHLQLILVKTPHF